MAQRGHEIVAEMVANVLTVAVGPGDQVAVGDTVCLLESMKMEIPVIAELPGVVTEVKVGVGRRGPGGRHPPASAVGPSAGPSSRGGGIRTRG